MQKQKTKLNKFQRFALSSVVTKSDNDLKLTPREKTMIRWFLKFQFAILFLSISLFITFQFIEIKPKTKNPPSKNTIETRKSIVKPVNASTLPTNSEKPLFRVVDEFQATIYAYNSFEAQTDGDPFNGAFGDITGMTNMVANNCYLPNTIVEIMGVKYKVFDRMNDRYGCDVFDIYMGTDHQKALNWGKRNLNVKILRTNR